MNVGENVEVKDIKGFEGKYAISSDGRVYSHSKVVEYSYMGKPTSKLIKGRWLKPSHNLKGYKCLLLGVGNNKVIHRLVAEAFIPNPENLPQVNHKDGIKTNNNVDNLEWVSSKENIKHSLENRLDGIMKITMEDIKYIRQSTKSKRDLAEEFNVHINTIYRVLNPNYIHKYLL